MIDPRRMTPDGVLVRLVLLRRQRESVRSVELDREVWCSCCPSGEWEDVCLLTAGVPEVVLAAVLRRVTGWVDHVHTATGIAHQQRRWTDPELIALQMSAGDIEAVAPGWHRIADELGLRPKQLRRMVDDARELIRGRLDRRAKLSVGGT